MTIEEAAEALGVELLPWQLEVGRRILNGEPVQVPWGRRAGRATLRRVLAHATGATGRSARQSATDHATRPERIEAVTRDLWADLDYYTTERGER